MKKATDPAMEARIRAAVDPGIWEHELPKNPEGCIRRIRSATVLGPRSGLGT